MALKRTPELKSLFNPVNKPQPEPIRFVAAFACISISIAVYYLFYGDFKLIFLYESHLEIFKQWSVLTFFAQVIYYISEAFLVLSIVCCIQVIATENGKVAPYGGLFLALTWGASHFITGNGLAESILTSFDWKLWAVGSSSNMTAGIYYIIISLLIGMVFNLLDQDFRYAFPAAALLYLL
jgi:hypothetical protein